jgi:hypothetical protein
VARILGRTRSNLLETLVAVPFAAQAFDDDLALLDAAVRAEVAELVTELVDRARISTALAA